MTTTEIPIRGDIGRPGLTETNFANELARAAGSDEVRLLIASDGGSVFSALSMISQLSKFPGQVVVEVESLAASAATFFLAVANRVEMHPHAMTMIHNSHAGTIGSHEDMSKMASVLKMIDSDIASLYSRKSGASKNDFLALMALETWATADETVEVLGIADVVLPARGMPPSAANTRTMNRSVRATGILNSMRASRRRPSSTPATDRAALMAYAARADQLVREQLEYEREQNQLAIVRNAKGDRDRAMRFLRWA